jgi:hypothetical protein
MAPTPTPASAVALGSLADMDAAGLRDGPAPFSEIVSAMLDLPVGLAQVSLPTRNTVIQCADFLRGDPRFAS